MKRNYQIKIKETLERVVDVKANSLSEAFNIVENKYKNEEYVLDYNDYKGTEFKEYRNNFKRKLEKQSR